ncbi:hypothetical protein BDV93DRAFT_527840 [Ceratobasidium sp. AG-I]|nr:hypothetical protein BDV93DRAFT_527840 [Ceratobasidium sp. AG-I]
MTNKRPGSPLNSSTPSLPADTPIKQSSTSTSNTLSSFLDTGSSSHKRPRTSESAATTETSRQNTILSRLRAELNGAVLHDPGFFEKLSCDNAQLHHILASCPLFDNERDSWRSPAGTGMEKQFYEPTLQILNAIGKAVHLLGTSGQPYIPFINQSTRLLESNFPGMQTAPDIIKCERGEVIDQLIHWHDVHLFIEVKKGKSEINNAIQQSARYARALLAHRIDRNFVKTLVVCGTTVVFLHFDRSGLVYSDDIDLYTEAKKFTGALAAMLLLTGTDAGYNSIFENIWTHTEGQISTLDHQVSLAGMMYAVKGVLCNRKSIRGRATLVLALHQLLETLDPEAANNTNDELHMADAVLKLVWRDPTRFLETLILKQFIGVYGICQLLSKFDAIILDQSYGVYPRRDLGPGPRGHVFGKQGQSIDIPGAQHDDARELSFLMMQLGRPLCRAKDASELKGAFVGAIMGQWALVNSHVQHRDISINNILLTAPGYRYKEPEWERLAKVGAEVCTREFKAPEWDAVFNTLDPLVPKYKKVERLKWKFDPGRRFAFLKRVIEEFGPEPLGFLCDVDLANILSLAREGPSDMHTHRTGTHSFMAIKLLLAEANEMVQHSYLHDLESFFWVLLYVVAEHCEPTQKPNPKAQQVIEELNTVDRRMLGHIKTSFISQIAKGTLDVRSFGTTWAISLAPVIQSFARWLDRVLVPDFDSTIDPDACFEQVLGIFIPCTCVATCHHSTALPERKAA